MKSRDRLIQSAILTCTVGSIPLVANLAGAGKCTIEVDAVTVNVAVMQA